MKVRQKVYFLTDFHFQAHFNTYCNLLQEKCVIIQKYSPITQTITICIVYFDEQTVSVKKKTFCKSAKEAQVSGSADAVFPFMGKTMVFRQLL